MKRFILGLGIIAMLGLAACTEESMQIASMGASSAQKTEAEKQLEAEARSLNQVSRNIVVKNTVEGAVIGAAAGCGFALLLGGNAEDCAKGAVAGGVVGGVAGNAVGKQAAAKNEEIVKTAEVVKNLTQVSQRLNTVEANLRSVVKSQDAEIRSLRRQLDADQISESAYKSRVRAINSNRTVVINQLQISEKNMQTASQELSSAAKQGQTGLSQVQRAAASNQQRLAKTRASIQLIDS